MKLKLRCLESRETLRIQVPSPCNLYELQQILSQSLSPPPPSRFALRFSLNARDDLSPPSPDASLESLGISSGVLVYFSTDPLAFSPNPSMRERDGETSISRTQIQESVSNTSGKLEEAADLGISLSNQETRVREMLQIQDLESNQTPISQETRRQCQNCSNLHESRSQALRRFQNMVEESFGSFEETKVTDIADDSGVKKLYELNFLKKVLRVELGDDCVGHKLMVLAVHAVLLESGFIGFNATSKMPIEHFHQPDDWPSAVFTISLRYTLPKLLTNCNSGSDVTDYVVIKFQNLGNFINVYGCLVKGSSVYRVCLDEIRFAPTLDSFTVNYDENGSIDEDISYPPRFPDGIRTVDDYSCLRYWVRRLVRKKGEDEVVSSKPYREKEVYVFWKKVKDGLALPLLIDLCERSGIALPACFMRLPTEVKLKILDLLPAKDLGRVECVCSEMRYLTSNYDLWKPKVSEVFGDEPWEDGNLSWRKRWMTLNQWRPLLAPNWRSTPMCLFTPMEPFSVDQIELDLMQVLGPDHHPGN